MALGNLYSVLLEMPKAVKELAVLHANLKAMDKLESGIERRKWGNKYPFLEGSVVETQGENIVTVKMIYDRVADKIMFQRDVGPLKKDLDCFAFDDLGGELDLFDMWMRRANPDMSTTVYYKTKVEVPK